MPLILAFKRQRQADLRELQAGQSYIMRHCLKKDADNLVVVFTGGFKTR